MSGKEKARLALWPWASRPRGKVTGRSRRFWLQSQRALVSSSVLATCPQASYYSVFQFPYLQNGSKNSFSKDCGENRENE